MTSPQVFMTFQGKAPPDYNPVLREIADTIEEHGDLQGWDPGLVFKINLALEEVTINIISYGGRQNGPSPNIEIGITRGEEDLTIQVSDDGRPFNPLVDAPPPPIIDESTRVAPIGGFGLHLVKTMMDSVTYRHDQGLNELTMTARREQAETA